MQQVLQRFRDLSTADDQDSEKGERFGAQNRITHTPSSGNHYDSSISLLSQSLGTLKKCMYKFMYMYYVFQLMTHYTVSCQIRNAFVCVDVDE